MKSFVLVISTLLILSLNALGNETIEKAKSYYYSSNFEMAKILLERIIKTTTNDEILLMLGNSYLATKDYKKAVEIFKSGVIIGQKTWVFEFNLGYAYYTSKDYSNSLFYFNLVKDKAPNFSKTYWYGGMSSLRLLDADTTINFWERYLQISPDGEESENIRKALALLKEFGTNAIHDIISEKDEFEDIDALIGDIKNGFEIKSEQQTLEDTSLEDIEK
ncbi:MAG: tetratricopeptide repeat protein [Spirochaetes bacterium]|nr:tetratricopeptide repeat protein [Spirochaetota bacterium]